MPVRDGARFLEAAVRSVLGQTFRDFELILWDDGSTDATPGMADALGAADTRVRVFHGPPRGVAVAMKEAHAHASGRYVGWVDADDVVQPTLLEETVAVLDAEPAVGVVYTDHVIMDAEGRGLGVGTRSGIPYSKERLLVDFMCFHFRLFRRACFDAAGGINASYATAHDYDFCLRMSEVCEMRRLPRALYGYRMHDGAISSGRRIEQIESSARAIREALSRRGMDATHELTVEIVGRYGLRRKGG